MKPIHSKALIAWVSFVLGITAVLAAEKIGKWRSPGEPKFVVENPRILPKSEDTKSERTSTVDDFDPFRDDPLFVGGANPFESMRKLQSKMFSRFGTPDVTAAEVKTREDKDFVYYDIPIKDLNREKLKVKVEDGQISISGQVEKKSEEEGSASYYTSSFHRTFPAPAQVDSERFQLEQMNDTLTLKFPKKMGV